MLYEVITQVNREFHDLFIGLGRGELLPYASYYLTGFLHEKPLAKLRGDMIDLGIERAEGVAEPEDNIASLMEMMAGLIRGEFGAVPSANVTLAGASTITTPLGPSSAPLPLRSTSSGPGNGVPGPSKGGRSWSSVYSRV